MYQIGICDDDFAFSCQIEGYLKDYAQKRDIEIEIEVFSSGEEYLKYLEKGFVLDLLFLDIEFGEKMDGVVVGHRVRSDLANEVTQIVYVSAKESYAMQLFQNRPMDFLVKPIKRNEIEGIMEKYRRVFSGKKSFFEFRVGKAFYRIASGEIMYFQCFGKKIQIKVRNGSLKEYYGRMADVEKQIDQDKFWVIHKSYIVNIDYISEFRVNEVVMVTGNVLPISRSNQKKIQEKLLSFHVTRKDIT